MKSVFFVTAFMVATLPAILSAAVPSAPPTGGVSGGIFSQYFENIKAPCTGSLDVITGFSNTMVRTCTPFANMMKGFLGTNTSSAGNVVTGFNPTTGLPTYGPGSPWLTTGTNVYYNAGNVGIGTSSPAAKLEVNGSVRAHDVCTSGGKCLSSLNTSTVYANQSCPSGQYVSGFNTWGTIQCANLPTTTTTSGGGGGGGMTCTSGHWTMGGYVCNSFSGPGIPGGWSDKKLKKDIFPIPHSLNSLTAIHGVRWTWKNPEKYGAIAPMGVIAQDVEAVYPDLVTEVNGVKTVQYHALIGPLIEAVKELDAENKAQDAKIEALEKRLESLSK